MGLMDKLKGLTGKKGKATEVVEEHGDKVAEAVDKATDVVDDKTGGKFTDQLDKVDDAVAKAVSADDDETPAGDPSQN